MKKTEETEQAVYHHRADCQLTCIGLSARLTVNNGCQKRQISVCKGYIRNIPPCGVCSRLRKPFLLGAVVINRLLSSKYPDTVVGVIYQKKQFSPVGSGRLEIVLTSGRANADCYRAAEEAMSGVTNVGNCLYFRTPIEGLTGISIGGHIFF